MKKKVEQVLGLPVDEYHGVGGEYILNADGKRVPLSAVEAVVVEEQTEQIEQEKE